MLGKLLKYEYKITSRYFIPMLLAVGATTFLLKMSFLFSADTIFVSPEVSTFLDIIQGLLIMLYVLVIGGTYFLALFLLIRRFYVNVFGDEGYLMHTLPVSGTQILNSKLICSFTWLLALIPVGLLSFFLLFSGTDIFTEMTYVSSMLMEEIQIMDISGFSVGLIITEFLLMMPLGIISALLTYYLSITLGQHFISNHRLLGAIVFYFGLSMINSMISSVFTTVTETVFDGSFMVADIGDLCNLLSSLLGASLVVVLVQIVVYYFLVRHFLNKKLNLY